MKQLTALQQQARRSNSFRGVDHTGADGGIKSAATIFWLVIHSLCCLISLVLGFRFSRLVFFLVFSTSSSPSTTNSILFSALQTTTGLPNSINSQTHVRDSNVSTTTSSSSSSRVVVGRHGILIRPWPHPDPVEVTKAHSIIDRVQSEQRSQFGVKDPRSVIVVTPTYVRTFQALHLTGVMHTLMNMPYDVTWIVVEAGGVTNETASVIERASGLKIVHAGFDGKMPLLWEDRHKLESGMRLHALRIIREQKLDGIVMFADDSNMHSLELFDEIHNVKWVGAVSVGILAHSVGGPDDAELPVVVRDDIEKDEKKSQVPVQGPACNSSNHLVGWQTFNTLPYVERSARYIGDRAVVLPRKLEWAGFVLNSRLVWEETEDKPEWVRDFEEVGRDGEDVESPLSLLKDTSVVEPLGSCGRKVMLWWLRVEARADSKFPARWVIDPPLDITVPAKRTPWPDAPPELPSSTVENLVSSTQENTEKHETTKSTTRPRRKRSSRSKRKKAAKVLDEHILSTTKHSSDN